MLNFIVRWKCGLVAPMGVLKITAGAGIVQAESKSFGYVALIFWETDTNAESKWTRCCLGERCSVL